MLSARSTSSPRSHLHRTAIGLCLAVTLCAGCPPAPTVVDVQRRYQDALRDGRRGDAWALLDTDARGRTRPEQMRAPKAPGGDSPPVYGARVETAHGELVFRESGGQWRLNSPLPGFDEQHTPEAALQTFARAVRVSDWSQVMRLVPPPRRVGLTEAVIAERMQEPAFRAETERAVNALRSAQRTEESTHRVVLRQGAHSAVLVRSPDAPPPIRWYLDDLR